MDFLMKRQALARREIAELDLTTAVATHVMGWTQVHPTRTSFSGPERLFGYRPAAPRKPRKFLPVPAFAADMHAAWLVVEHMRAAGWLFTLSSVGVEWRAQFARLQDRMLLESTSASAPAAIAWAAVRACIDVELATGPSTGKP